MEITSVNNTLIKETAKLRMKKYRDERKQFLAEGEHMVTEAARAGLLVTLFLVKEYSLPLPCKQVITVTPEVMKKLSDTVSSSPVIGICNYPLVNDIPKTHVVLLDGVQDPGNLGTILRTALSFGFTDIYLSPNTVDPYNEKVLRSTQGALFSLQLYRANLQLTVQTLKQAGYAVYGTALQHGEPLSSFKPVEKIALVFGNEGQGMSKEILASTDKNIFIEMQGFESLNVAVAAGIAMYHFRNR